MIYQKKKVLKTKEILGTAFRIRFIGGWISVFICVGINFFYTRKYTDFFVSNNYFFREHFSTFDTIAFALSSGN